VTSSGTTRPTTTSLRSPRPSERVGCCTSAAATRTRDGVRDDGRGCLQDRRRRLPDSPGRYPEGQAVSAERIRRILEDQPHELTSEAETPDVGVDARFARVEARVPLAPDRDREPIRDPPQVTWGASFDADAGTVTIRHEAGEEVDAGWLWYDVDFPDDYGEIERFRSGQTGTPSARATG